jgi:hypothetical protein
MKKLELQMFIKELCNADHRARHPYIANFLNKSVLKLNKEYHDMKASGGFR